MKKFLAIALFLVLVASVFVVASGAAETDYWEVNRNCLVKVKGIEDEEGNITVPTFKAVEENNAIYDGLIVGLPTYATVGDEFFEAKEGYYFIYADANDNELYYSDYHLGTADKIVVYDENDEIAATYGIVTYGDADGDGVFDVIDSAIAARCLNGFLDAADEPAVYEAVKPRIGVNNELIDILDYQMIVNDSVAGEVEENLKGRKTPIDETLFFESVIYENTGEIRIAEFTAEDNNFKGLVTNIYYNGSDEVLPKESGIYSVTINVADSEKYLVTPGERNLGFIVIAPKAGTGYTIVADNANKTVSVNIANAYSSFDSFNTSINNWCNSAYSLSVNGTSVSAYANVLSALTPRNYNVYSGQSSTLVTTTSKTVLGSYLKDDAILYEDYTAKRSVPVTVSSNDVSFTFNLDFGQDKSVVKAAIKSFELKNAGDGRGQRIDNQSRNVNCYGLKDEITGERIIRAVVKKHGSTSSNLQSTGLKSMMVGYVDAIEFLGTTTKGDYSSADVMSMYNSSNERYSSFSGIQAILKAGSVITDFLKNLGMGTPTNTSSLKGKVGWAYYHCSIASTGLRYGIEYRFEFTENLNVAPVHYKLNVENVDGCTITTTPEQDKVYKTTTYYYEDFMAEGEPFSISAKLADGYKLSVTDANGNPVAYDAYTDLYIMPASNVTVTAVKS